MRKFIIFLLVLICLLSACFHVFAQEDENNGNIIPSINSDFEDANTIEDTQWFKLIDSFGDSKEKNLTGMEIKTGSAHSGEKYLSMSGDKSWHSPSINLYPFFKEAGAGEYILTFYIRSEAALPPTFMVRGLASDLEPDVDTFPALVDRGGSNYYFSYKGTTTEESGWYLFESELFEVSAQSLEKNHNWWFVLGSSPKGEFTYDIDDFRIIPADEYVSPNEISATEITYLSRAAIDNAFEKTIPALSEEPPAPIVDPAANDITLYICIGIGGAAVVTAALIFLTSAKKKKH